MLLKKQNRKSDKNDEYKLVETMANDEVFYTLNLCMKKVSNSSNETVKKLFLTINYIYIT